MKGKILIRLGLMLPLAVCSCDFDVPDSARKAIVPDHVPAESSNILITEIMFNPPSGGADYVELMNIGDLPYNLGPYSLAALDEGGAVLKKYRISDLPYWLMPGQIMVLTTDKKWLCRTYDCDSLKVIQVKTMPPMNNSDGHIALLDPEDRYIQEITYNESMHFPFIKEVKGVSLERLFNNYSVKWEGNWHSASSTCGFASPGQLNSQRMQNQPEDIPLGFSLLSDRISPNADGKDDLLQLRYRFDQSGYIGYIRFCHCDGSVVIDLWSGLLFGTSGILIWDACKDSQRLLPGLYFLHIKYNKLQGKSSQLVVPIRIDW